MAVNYYKSILYTIKQIWTRFLSILLICFLGATVLTGLLATSKDMELTIQHHFKKMKLYNFLLISNFGFDQPAQQVFKNQNAIFLHHMNINVL